MSAASLYSVVFLTQKQTEKEKKGKRKKGSSFEVCKAAGLSASTPLRQEVVQIFCSKFA